MTALRGRLWLAVVALALAAACGGNGGTAATDPATEGDGTEGEATVRVGQVVPSLGFVSLDVARADGMFAKRGIDLEWSLLSGGDPATLAALDGGNIDIAAIGSQTPVTAISKGEEYQIIYSLMSQMSIDLTMSNAHLKEVGISADDPVEEKLQALKGATIGVSALGGAQDRIARWLADRAGLDPEADLEIVLVGPPPALRAGLENGNIDGFVLTAPTGQLVEEAGAGTVLVELGSEIDELSSYDHLILVIRKDYGEQNREVVVRTLQALIEADRRVAEDAGGTAELLHANDYEEVPLPLLTASVKSLQGGVGHSGRLNVENIAFLLEFTAATGYEFDRDLDAAEGEGDWWTNEFIDLAIEGA